jgi:hypothetical protein
MFGVCMRLFSIYVTLRVGSGLAAGWSLVQGVLPSVKKKKIIELNEKPEVWMGQKSHYKKKGKIKAIKEKEW